MHPGSSTQAPSLINKDNLATVEKDMAKLTSDMVKTWKDKYF